MPSSLNGTGVTFNDGSTLQSGNIPTANLGSGTANSSTFLRGDRTFVTLIVPQVIRPRIFNSSGTWTRQPDVTAIFIMARGATGRHGSGNASRGGVGGSGYAELFIASPAASFTVTIGAAGTGSGAGGTTSVSGISITGSGGVGSTNAGSAGGVASGGGFNANGGKGGNGFSPFRPGGGGGAAGGRYGSGFNGGNGRNAEGGSGGGGGGTGGAGGTSTSNGVGGASGVSTSTVSASVVSFSPFMSPPSSIQSPFGAGLVGRVDVGAGGGGGGGAGSNQDLGGYGLPVPQGVGGKGGNGGSTIPGSGSGPASGQVIIWELI